MEKMQHMIGGGRGLLLLLCVCAACVPPIRGFRLAPLYFTQRACSASAPAGTASSGARQVVVVPAGLSYLSTVLASAPSGRSDILLSGASQLSMVDLSDIPVSDESAPQLSAGGGG